MKFISTDKAPAAIGHYSQAVESNGMLFISGQIPINPATGELVESEIKLQTEQVMKNLLAIIDAAGLKVENMVKATIFIKDMGKFAEINEIYAKYLKDHKPARAVVEVSRLPKDVLIELEAICIR
jgi:2-iminobutanoate/2-iminopropanoate deaminase